MDIYSKGSTPKLNSPGNNYYYEGANSYKAADIGTVQSSVESELKTMEADFSTSITKFQKTVESLDEGFGEKFIMINQKKLGFVDVEAFQTLLDKLKKAIDTSVSDSNSFFSTCSSEITAINQWLSTLESNASSYNAAASAFQKYSGKSDDDSISQASHYQGIMNQYQKLSGEPTSHGEWIKE